MNTPQIIHMRKQGLKALARARRELRLSEKYMTPEKYDVALDRAIDDCEDFPPPSFGNPLPVVDQSAGGVDDNPLCKFGVGDEYTRKYTPKLRHRRLP